MSPSLRTPQPARHPEPTARVAELTHLIFERPDLDRAAAFLADFGLAVAHRTDRSLYLRGTGPAHYCYRIERGERARFLGAGYSVATRAELERLGRLEGASSLTESSHPGRGELVTLRDPCGFLVEVLGEREPAAALPQRAPLELQRERGELRVNATQRLQHAPPNVVRLGHYVLEVPEYQAVSAWYTRHLGFIPSDVAVFDDGSPAVTFFRLDRGSTPADHHTLALAQGVLPVLGHAAFEVIDADAIGMGNTIMREKGWKHAWGIGRHLLGSQIFDYWEDPWGTRHEHYCDGDLFTSEQPLGVHEISRDSLAQWGPPLPRSFTKPRLSPSALVKIARNAARGPDLDVRKLGKLIRLFG
jgi:catechol 2,3-dioxygenase-like lactoylglutathione lyase family enzyme